MDGERFDRLARGWAHGSRRGVLAGLAWSLLAGLPSRSSAARRKHHPHKHRRNDRDNAQDQRESASGVSGAACAAIGGACAADAGCCAGICQKTGACTRKKKKKGKKKKTVFTGSCRCAEQGCVPDNAAACAGKQCGSAVNNCGAAISCGSCGAGAACQGGSCVCVPSCLGKQCGSNGCDGSCGTCSGGKTCQDGTCACPFPCCPRRHNPITADCQCIDKGPVTLSLLPGAASVASGGTIDLTVRLEMFQDSHLPSFVSVGLSFNAAVFEPVHIQRPSATAGWDELERTLDAGFAGISIGAGLNPGNILQHSADVLVFRLKAIGNSGTSTAVTFSNPLVLSISECDQFSENILDAVTNTSVGVS